MYNTNNPNPVTVQDNRGGVDIQYSNLEMFFMGIAKLLAGRRIAIEKLSALISPYNYFNHLFLMR